ncbi:MAG: MgtC/SapB family protein [Thermoplasmata archaeon]
MEQLLELMIYFSLALISGFAVGIEREHHSRAEMHTVVSGVRSFTFTSIVGFLITYYLKDSIAYISLIVGIILVVFLAVPIIKGSKMEPGLTTAVALVLVLSVGMLYGMGLLIEGVVIVGITLIVLAVKEKTHRFAKVLSKEELNSALRFLTIAAVLIPLAYTIGDVHPLIGPGKVFDPVKALIVVVFVSSISFSSYLIIKTYGAKKGLEITAFLGGLVSSAAACASLSQKAKKNPLLVGVVTRGILLANLSMMVKCIIIIAPLTDFTLIVSLSLPISVMAISTVLSIISVKKREVQVEDGELELGTPFSVIPAAKFGALYLLISGISYFGRTYLGNIGVYSVALGGLVSTTSISASLGSLYSIGEITVDVVISTLVLALGLGSLSKLFISWAYSKRLSKKLALHLMVIVVISVFFFFYHL